MVFTSIAFLIFFPAATILYYLTPSKYKWITLLITSYFFYINIKPVFIFLVIGITLSTYYFTNLIDKTKIESRKKVLMQINIVLILLPLFFFKYYSNINDFILNFLNNSNIRWPFPEIKLLLPIGISFYTFMAIGYTIDVYNEEIKAEKDIGILALFISYFPLILSGPIERAKNIIPQFKTPKDTDYATLVKGLKLMLWGYFMKLAVADRVGIFVDNVYDYIPENNGATILIANILYPFQMYADFGGYSLIAIGSAEVLGINVMQNFNRPFFATSISEFWRRWHISLISWLTDYIYTPLSFAYRKYKIGGIVIAIMITFLISGIWHGASLTFVIWGILHGIYLSIEAITNNKKALFEKRYNLKTKKWYIFLGIIITFILFDFSQIFGRANSLDDSFLIFKKLITDFDSFYIEEPAIFYYSILGIFILIFTEFIGEYFPKVKLLNNQNTYIRFFTVLFIIIYIVSFGVFDVSQFIYFQF